MRNARGGGGGFLQRAGLIMAAMAILALTFTLGILVGRQWGGRGAPAPSGVEVAKKPGVIARRSGLIEAEGDRPRELQEKLTFYQTLTAPMGPTGSSARARATEDRARAAASTPAPAAEAGAAPDAPAGSASWSVQVGAFRSRQQADGIQKQLEAAGFPVSQSAVAAEDGRPRYRVRVVGARSRDEALRLAERVRARVSVTTFVTAN
jgi:cell division septation protein DedD